MRAKLESVVMTLDVAINSCYTFKQDLHLLKKIFINLEMIIGSLSLFDILMNGLLLLQRRQLLMIDFRANKCS